MEMNSNWFFQVCDIHHCPFSVPLLKDNHGWILDWIVMGIFKKEYEAHHCPEKESPNKPGYFLVVLEVALEGRPLRFP